jgi:dipeptidyl aminopeptidase/acylaminoacyl peptidase
LKSASKTLIALSLLLFPLAAVSAQETGRVYADADYAQAEKFMPYNVNQLVLHAVNNPVWLADGRVWYRDAGPKGLTYVLIDPVKKTKGPAFDQAKLATALQAAVKAPNPLNPYRLPIQDFTLANGDKTVLLTFRGRDFNCDLSGDGVCTAIEKPGAAAPAAPTPGRRGPSDEGEAVLSPDHTKAVFIRDWNLWIRETATGKEVQVTFDGVKDFGYATENAGWIHSNDPIVVWSPDSKKIATYQQDQRKTGELYIVPVTNRHPELEVLKYPLVGDKDVTMIERVIVDVANPSKAKVVRLKMPPDQHRGTLCDDLACRGGDWEDTQWSADSETLAFVSTSRDHKQEWMRLANAKNGDVRDVMNETVKGFFESGNDKVNWRYLSGSNELLWFSERSGWGHLYLYDIASGKLKTQITSGDWNVTQVLGIDEKARTLFFLGVGREPSVDPYFEQYYRVNFDGSGMELLTPEKRNNVITPSPDNRFFVDVLSTPTEPQIAVVRDAHGNIVVDVAREDIAKLKETGWIPPVQIMVKARDGQTDLYGFLFRPTNFSTSRKYPIVNHVYPGPQTGSCGARTFQPAHGDLQSLAELGFIVVCIDGMGTPFRSKAFHETWATDMGDNTIPDQVTGMQQLAERYPWIDLSRAGIFGHSGGGNATAAAMFHYPDFFKVGIAESGNHDNRMYEDDWAEKWTGLEVDRPDGTSNYDSQANQSFAKNLKGHLLLAHGTSDDNVPVNQTLLVVDALIKANKDFDLILFPNAHHGYGPAADYMTRLRWDYFVRYLADSTPPHEYLMHATARPGYTGTTGPADVDWSEPEGVAGTDEP